MPSKGASSYRYSLPTADEIATSSLLIKKYKDEIHGLAIRIKDLRADADESSDPGVKADFKIMIQQLSNEMEQVKNLMAERESTISRIRLLPAELLAEVFVCHVLDNGHLPWTLLAVCRSWRYVAIGTPRLWSRLHLKNRAHGHTIMRYAPSYPCGIICDTYDTLELVLTRSGIVPLDVTLELVLPPDDGTLDLLCGQAGPRWGSVKWEVRGIDGFPKLWEDMAPGFPRLQRVILGERCDALSIGPFISTIQSTSPNLRALSIQTPLAIQHIESKGPLLKRIRHFHWNNPIYHSTLDTEAYARATWLHLRGLETLTLQGNSISPFSQHREDGGFRSLSTLAVRSWHLGGLANCAEQLNSLTHLHLESMQRSLEVDQQHSIRLANVTHFTFINERYRPLSMFLLPSLISLELYGNNLGKNDANDEMDDIWNAGTFGKAPSPSLSFHLEPRANDAYLLVALGFMDRLKELYLYYDSPAHVGTKLMTSLAVPPRKKVVAGGPTELKKWRAPTCSELETLVVVCKKVSAKEREVCLDALTKINEARLGTASEMKVSRLALYSKYGKGSRNKASKLMSEWTDHYDD